MFEIIAKTHLGHERTEKYLDGTFAHQTFLWFTQAVDAAEVIMIDGETGEILNLWKNGKFEVFNGYLVG